MDRVKIGRNYVTLPMWRHYLGVPLVYLPIIVMIPFILLGVVLLRWHLRLVGATNLRTYWSFVPSWASHRYRLADQPVFHTATTRWQLRAYRWYWVFNCKLYCPLSVALFRYCAYLVMIVENWWCPFGHDKKSEYAIAPIDQSYWHIFEKERNSLHPDDRNNPIWNDEVTK